jgi:hypothetical protein
MTQGAPDTLSETMNRLKKEGYTVDFNLRPNGLTRSEDASVLLHHDFVVDSYFRFEGNSDPADEAILYAISVPQTGVKGVLVNGYGIYSEPLTNEMAAKLSL